MVQLDHEKARSFLGDVDRDYENSKHISFEKNYTCLVQGASIYWTQLRRTSGGGATTPSCLFLVYPKGVGAFRCNPACVSRTVVIGRAFPISFSSNPGNGRSNIRGFSGWGCKRVAKKKQRVLLSLLCPCGSSWDSVCPRCLLGHRRDRLPRLLSPVFG